MTTTTPDMNLVLPDVSVTAGPQWATLLNAAFTLIDSHDHSSGKGVQITPSGLNISSDLTFSQNNATNLRSARLFNNTSFTPGGSDRTALYALNGELYYIDASANQVQLTLNGAIDVNGAITSLSIKDTAFFLQYFGDITRQVRFNVSAVPTSTTRIISIPDSGANDTMVTQAATQTLTNKTLTAPVIAHINTGSVDFTLPTIDGSSGQVLTTNGSTVLTFANVPSAPPANIAANDSNVTFTNSDNRVQICTPTAARTYTMPSSISASGVPWTFYNQATSWSNIITIQTSGSNTITVVPPQGFVTIMPLVTSPTAAANWYLQDRQSTEVAYTATFTGFGTVSTNNCVASVFKSVLRIRFSMSSGTPTATTASVSTPISFISTGLIPNSVGGTGSCVGSVASGGGNAMFAVTAPTTSTSVVYVGATFASAGNPLVAANGNSMITSGNGLAGFCEVPIA